MELDVKEISVEEVAATPAIVNNHIGLEDIQRAMAILREYKSGKAVLETQIVANEQWWKLRHWDTLNLDKKTKDARKRQMPTSAWLFNSIANKHADAMDNFPGINVLPRARDDEAAARELSVVIPAILDANNYEQIYSDTWWYKLKQGTGVKGVFWDSNKQNGLGDVTIKKLDLLNLFWEPGITDIQQSRNFFSVELRSNDLLREEYPDIQISGNGTINIDKYILDDAVNTKNKSVVVDWYYKKAYVIKDANGDEYTKTLLHYCKFVNDYIIYASENDEACADTGFYAHGKYPFIFDPLYPIEGTPVGFGCIDLMKSSQYCIDKLDEAMLENALVSSRKRFFVRTDGSVNEDEFLDLSKPIVHSDGNLGEDSIREIQYRPLSGIYYNIKQGKVEELKETSGNRDFSQGATASGVTAASAISALQEAGSKLSRDMLKASYRAFVDECYLIIELLRQFYDEPRVFRITGKGSDYDFVEFDNTDIRMQSQGEAFGIDLGYRLPVFDIKVSAQKQSMYSQMSQNELALQLYGQGFFDPARADQALACVEMMNFEGKEATLDKIRQGKTMYEQLQEMQNQMNKMVQVIDSQNGTDLTEQVDAVDQSAPLQASAPKTDIHKSLAQRSAELARNATAPR